MFKWYQHKCVLLHYIDYWCYASNKKCNKKAITASKSKPVCIPCLHLSGLLCRLLPTMLSKSKPSKLRVHDMYMPFILCGINDVACLSKIFVVYGQFWRTSLPNLFLVAALYICEWKFNSSFGGIDGFFALGLAFRGLNGDKTNGSCRNCYLNPEPVL